MKKLFAVLLVISMICYSAFAMPFTDVDKNTETGAAVEKLWKLGYVNGYDGKNFAPLNNLTRAEFVKLVNRVFFYNQGETNPFKDVSKNDWFYKDVSVAYQAGYISGMGDGRFCPEEKVTTEQICVILDNILNLAEIPTDKKITDNVSDWAKGAVLKALSFGYVSTDENGALRATYPATRGEAAVILAKCIIEEPDISKIEPIDLSTLADDVLKERMTAIVKSLREDVLPLCYLDEQREVIRSIAKSMESYMNDRSFDYKKAEKDTFEIYASMKNRDDRLALQAMITENISINDLVIIFDFFFPDGSGEL